MEILQHAFPAFVATKSLLLCIAAILVRFCDAQHLICNVTQVLNGTLYSVPEVEATQCSYSWMNSTGHVLANEKGQMEQLVFNSSLRTLLSRKCWVQLNYTRGCVSEGIQYTAYCLTDCITPETRDAETPWQYWGIAISVSVVVLLICSAFKRRSNPPSKDDDEAQDIRNEQEF